MSSTKTTASPIQTTVHFGDFDISHIGRLFRLVRLGRGGDVRQKDVALEAQTDPSTLNRFERTGNDETPVGHRPGSSPLARRSGYFEDYVNALRRDHINGRAVADPLKDEDAALLLAVYAMNNTPGKVLKRQHDLAAIELDLLQRARPDNHLRPLWQLEQKLRLCERPAFIADPLWFIHALNGPLLNLFALHPQRHADYFSRWEAWHVMGSKFTANSPIRDAHVSYNDYFPPTVDQFYRAICPYLFTRQVRGLAQRLISMSNANGLRFGTWWHNSVAFRMSFEPEQLRRRLWFQDPVQPNGERIVLRTVAHMLDSCEVPLCADGSYTAAFWLAVWSGDDPASEEIIDNLHAPLAKDAIFYATDYDVRHDFHANTWPEIGPLLAL